jgi:hypothetical protein
MQVLEIRRDSADDITYTQLALAIISLDLRLCITYQKQCSEGDDIFLVEYYFTKSYKDALSVGRSPGNDVTPNIFCCSFKSPMNDPLKIYGLIFSWEDFEKKFLTTDKIYVGNRIFYHRIEVGVYPLRWYPCFHTAQENERMLDDIKKRRDEIYETAKEFKVNTRGSFVEDQAKQGSWSSEPSHINDLIAFWNSIRR